MRKLLFVLLASCGLFLSACGPTLQVNAVDGAFGRVADRHDKYIKEDAKLSELEKSVYLRDTALLRKAIAEAKKTPTTQPTK